MPVRTLAIFAILVVFASCYPDKKCAGELVFDDASALCYACPAGSKYKNQTCECMEGYEFIGLKCVLMDGAMPAMPDAGSGDMSDASTDAAAYEGVGCQDYCSFMSSCLGTNSLAAAVLPEVVTGLHADDAAACQTSCKSDLGSDEATDPALKCMVDGAEALVCPAPAAEAQMGLQSTLGLVGKCCGANTSSPLCKSICETLKASPTAGSMVDFCG